MIGCFRDWRIWECLSLVNFIKYIVSVIFLVVIVLGSIFVCLRFFEEFVM